MVDPLDGQTPAAHVDGWAIRLYFDRQVEHNAPGWLRLAER